MWACRDACMAMAKIWDISAGQTVQGKGVTEG